MHHLVLRFALNENTGSFDALAVALRRETGATIRYLNEELVISSDPPNVSRIETAITILVGGEAESVQAVVDWLDRLVGLASINLIDSGGVAQTLFGNGLTARK